MYNKILVPLDGSGLSESVLPYVEKLAKDCQAKEIVLFRICESPNVSADYPDNMPHSWEEHVSELTASSKQQCSLYLQEARKKLEDMGFSNVKLESHLGDPATEIVEYAAENGIELIIMASHGRSGPSRWAYGSTADKVFRSTCVPIMLIRAPGCVAGI